MKNGRGHTHISISGIYSHQSNVFVTIKNHDISLFQSLLSDVTKSHLTLNVYDEDKFGADTFLGSVEFNLVRLRTSHLEVRIFRI